MKLRPFVLGLVIGALLASTASVAANNLIQATLMDNYRIIIEDRVIDMTGYYILNYNDRIYTPVRPIAEGLGLNVQGDSERAILTRPTPTPGPIATPKPTPTPSATPTPTPSPTPTPKPTPTPTISYVKAPRGMTRQNVTIEFLSMSSDKSSAIVQVDVINDNDHPVLIDIPKCYIEAKGIRLPAERYDSSKEWGNSLGKYESYRDLDLAFKGDLKGEKKVTIYIELKLLKEFAGFENEVIKYTMSLDFSEDD